MKNKSIVVGMLILALVTVSLGLIGCVATPPVSGGGAIDAVGVSHAQEIQYYAGATFELVLMRTKNNEPDTTAVVKKGVPSYTREKIIISYNTPCVVVRHETADDGRIILVVAFEKDETQLLRFIQSSNELGYHTTFDLLYEGDSDVPVVKYGNAYYTVRSYVNVATGRFQVAQVSTRPFLGIKETIKEKSRNVTGRKL
jgi:hypothetical protein